MLAQPVRPSQAASTEPQDVGTLRAGLGSVAQVFVGEYEETGPLAEPVPLSDTAPGAVPLRPGDALDLSTVLKQGVTDKLVQLQTSEPAGDLDALVAQVNTALDGTVAGATLQVTAGNPVSDPDATGFDVTITVSKTSPAAVALTDPSGPGGAPLTLRSPATAPFDLAFTFAAALRTNGTGTRFWLTAGSGKPSVKLTAALAGDSPYTFPTGEAAVGVGDVRILAGSTVDLDATWSGTVDDTNGDGRLTISEPTLDGTGTTPGELTMPPDALTSFARTGNAAASVKLGSDVIPLDSSPAPALTLNADLGTAVDLVADVTGAPGDLADLAAFTRLNAVDLISGVIQYATMLRALQKHPNVDADLPLAGGRISDLHDLGADLAKLADDQIDIVPFDQDADPTDDDVVEVVVVKIQTIGDLADLIDDLPGFSGGPLEPTYDSATHRVRMNVRFAHTLDGLSTLDLPDGSEVAQLTFGDQLRGQTGLRAVSRPGGDTTPVDPQVDAAFNIDLPILVDLTEATPVDTDDMTTPVVEFESPMVYERFETELKSEAELDVTTVVNSGVEAAGSIGFVPVVLGGTYQLKQDGTHPTTVADIDPPSGGENVMRIADLITGVYEKDGNPPTYPVAVASRHAVVDADLTVNGHGDKTTDVLTATAGTIAVDRTGFDGPFTTALTNDSARLLRALDVDTATPTRLLGRILDTTGEVGDAVDSIDDGLSSAGLSVPAVPFINKTVGSLLRDTVALKAGIDKVRGGPTPVDLADLERDLQTQLGLAAEEVKFQLQDLDPADGAVDPALVLRFDAETTKSAKIPLSLQGAGVPSIAGSGTPGQLDAEITGALDLGILVPLNTEGTSAPVVRMLNGSEVKVTGKVTESPPGSAQLAVQLGAFSAQLGDSTNKTGRLGLGARLTVERSGAPEPGSAVETPITLSDYFGAGLTVTPSSASPTGKFTCDPDPDHANPPDLPTVEGTYGCATLPVLVDLGSGLKTIGGNDPANPAPGDYLTVDIDDLSAPAFDAPDSLDTFLQSLNFSFDGFEDGLGSLSQLLDTAIQASTIGGKLPLVGEDLTELASGLNDLKTLLDNPAAVLDLPSGDVATVLYGPSGLRAKLATELNNRGILRDSDYQDLSADYPGDPAGDTTPNATDIRLVPICDGALCPPAASLGELDEVIVELELGQGSRDVAVPGTCAAGEGTSCPGEVDLPIDLGLPGLPLTLSSHATARAGWTLELGFGLSRTDGFFLLDNPVPGTGAIDTESAISPQELRINIGAELAPGDSGKIEGVIGFIGMEATDAKPTKSGAKLLAQIGLDAPGPCTMQPAPYNAGLGGTNCTGRILGSQLLTSDPAQFIGQTTLTGGVDIALHIATGITGEDDTVNEVLPSFETDFKLGWGFGAGLSSLPEPTISLENIRVAPGQIFNKLFGEVLNELGPILEPAEPVREFLFAPIPVISDLSQYFGGPPVSLIDLAKLTGTVDVELLKDLDELLTFLQNAAAFTSDQKITLVQQLDIKGTVAQGPPRTPDQIPQLWDAVQSSVDLKNEIKNFLNGQAAGRGNEWTNLGVGGGGDGQDDFSYPVFQDPECLVGLLLGNDCAIVEWRPDLLNVHMEYTASFGPFFGVLYVTIGGELDAKAQVGAGVSTRGVRMLAEDPALDAGAEGVAKPFVQSLFLTDLDRSGKDIPEFTVSGTIKAGAKFDALVVAAGVDGGITATFALNLDDRPQADGRMYIDEIISKINTPICLFVIEGKLVAFLEVWARFGVCPFCHKETWRLATITLFEFSSQCDSKPPKLARVGDPDGTVYLNVGMDAGKRESLTNIQDEAYVVRQVSKDPDVTGTYKFSISAFGYTQEYEGKRIKITDAAAGKDSFLFIGQGEPAADNGSTNDVWPFSANIDAKLGADNDAFVGGSGDDTVAGNAGDDSINFGDGTNTGWGDATTGTSEAGNDTLIGGRGVDTLHGGPLSDVIDGGLEADFLYGDGGIDNIHGGHDVLKVPPGKPAPPNAQPEFDKGDLIEGGGGNDTLTGGSGNDTIYGDEKIDTDDAGATTVDNEPAGNDLIEGSGEVDTIFAGNGDDTANGGFLFASAGKDEDGDHVHGNGGDDKLFGSFGDDDLWGGPDADRIFGDDGEDDGHGQSGHDPEVRGGPGADQLWGGGGDDTIFGDEGADEIIGDGDDAKTEEGGDAKEAVGNDTTDGGAGGDIVLGDNGTVTGSPGSRAAQPSETVGVGDASLGGGPGDDRIYGEGGGDTLYGGPGGDLLHGNGGEDVVHGQTGADEAWGDADHDELFGGPGGDVVFGNAADDDLHGQEGVDLLVGGHPDPAGKDTNDHLFGGPEDDRIFGDDVTIAAGA
ncbi:MAG TPA: calcium-binding protein, partial [Jiangellales bacterium]|nr:calcium-binding protein [Jiangellales bacterium]